MLDWSLAGLLWSDDGSAEFRTLSCEKHEFRTWRWPSPAVASIHDVDTFVLRATLHSRAGNGRRAPAVATEPFHVRQEYPRPESGGRALVESSLGGQVAG